MRTNKTTRWSRTLFYAAPAIALFAMIGLHCRGNANIPPEKQTKAPPKAPLENSFPKPAIEARKPVDERFVYVQNGRFFANGQPYVFVGINFWQGAYLAADVIPGGRARLVRELDLLQQNGITNLRITASAEKSDIDRSVRPAFQDSPRKYNESLLVGLDFLVAEMAKRNMRAVLVMNNFWEWTGGMAQYVSWTTNRPVHDPAATNDATAYMASAASFYSDKEARQIYLDYIRHVIERVNTVTNTAYKDDPTIMTWQLANEPRPHPDSKGTPALFDDFYDWIDASATYIHSLAPKQLVTIGNEGEMGCLNLKDVYVKAHSFPSVDYLTFHIWPKNWGWFKPTDESTLDVSIQKTLQYLEDHVAIADALKKPTVLEEFGIGRDGENPRPEATLHARDTFLKAVFDTVEKDVAKNRSFAGTNFWSWGGEGRARNPASLWVEGDFTGDPPQEPQGLNSVFDQDTSTLSILRNHAENLGRTVR